MLYMLSEVVSGLPVISQDVDSDTTVTRQETLVTTSDDGRQVGSSLIMTIVR